MLSGCTIASDFGGFAAADGGADAAMVQPMDAGPVDDGPRDDGPLDMGRGDAGRDLGPDMTGGCEPPCANDETCCEAACVDVRESTAHCGGCGRTCAPPANGTAFCTEGTCDFRCIDPFRDCNDDPGDGCEVVPPRYGVDGDGDGFLRDGAARFCPDEIPPGSVAGPDEVDCDDDESTTNPDADEACNGADNDCDERVDEGFFAGGARVGGVCVCEVGASPGTVVCTDDEAAARCDFPAEDCGNGVDDDCDGDVDDADEDCADPCLRGFDAWTCTDVFMPTFEACTARCGGYEMMLRSDASGGTGSCRRPGGGSRSCSVGSSALCSDCRRAFDAGCCDP